MSFGEHLEVQSCRDLVIISATMDEIIGPDLVAAFRLQTDTGSIVQP